MKKATYDIAGVVMALHSLSAYIHIYVITCGVVCVAINMIGYG